jgi:hypothetical protein
MVVLSEEVKDSLRIGLESWRVLAVEMLDFLVGLTAFLLLKMSKSETT